MPTIQTGTFTDKANCQHNCTTYMHDKKTTRYQIITNPDQLCSLPSLNHDLQDHLAPSTPSCWPPRCMSSSPQNTSWHTPERTAASSRYIRTARSASTGPRTSAQDSESASNRLGWLSWWPWDMALSSSGGGWLAGGLGREGDDTPADRGLRVCR